MRGPESFKSLLIAARDGATWAWQSLLDDVEPQLRAYVRRQGAEDTDDVVSETWLHVARGIHRFDGDEGAFRSWVFMIGHHRIIDERRRKRRKPTDATEDAVLDAKAPSNRSAESEALEIIGEDDLVTVLDELPAAQREVILLRFVGGFGISEIASIIGKRPGAVQALQRRAFSRLRILLAQRHKELGPSSE